METKCIGIESLIASECEIKELQILIHFCKSDTGLDVIYGRTTRLIRHVIIPYRKSI